MPSVGRTTWVTIDEPHQVRRTRRGQHDRFSLGDQVFDLGDPLPKHDSLIEQPRIVLLERRRGDGLARHPMRRREPVEIERSCTDPVLGDVLGLGSEIASKLKRGPLPQLYRACAGAEKYALSQSRSNRALDEQLGFDPGQEASPATRHIDTSGADIDPRPSPKPD